VLVFLDDILVYSGTTELYVQHLTQVLSMIKENKLVNKKKCSFGQPNLDYLGHIISGQGVSADQKKVEAVWKWLTPKDTTTLIGFLGHVVQWYGKIAKLLT